MFKKIIYILPFILLSCQINDEWKTWTIKKDNYACKGAYAYTYASNNMDFLFKFDTSAVYQLKESQINKIYGLCPGFNALHESYRFGWKYYFGKIQIYAYIHDEGSTIKKLLGEVEISKINKGSIHLVDSGGYFILNEKQEFIKFQTNIKNKYFILFPYFGGQTPAQNDIYIQIKQLKSQK
jgi:hypothetical protein